MQRTQGEIRTLWVVLTRTVLGGVVGAIEGSVIFWAVGFPIVADAVHPIIEGGIYGGIAGVAAGLAAGLVSWVCFPYEAGTNPHDPVSHANPTAQV